MNIAFPTTEFCTEKNEGGFGRYLDNISTIFSEKDHRVFIIVLSDKDEEFEWKQNVIINRVRFKSIGENHGLIVRLLCKFPNFFWNRFGKSYVIRKRIRELNAKYGIDIIQHSNLQNINYFLDKRIPTVVRISGDHVLCFAANNYDYDYVKACNMKTDWMYDASCRALKNADSVFASSGFAAEEIGKRYGIKIDVIESPFIECDNIDYSVYRRVLDGKKYLLFFGTLNFLKGIRAIAEGLEDFLRNNKDIYFVFCGYDSELIVEGRRLMASNYINEMAGDYNGRVIILDRIDNKAALMGIVKNALACVLPSRVDNLPNTCIEAMSLGKIVVGTRGASFDQMITDGDNGFLCEIDDTDSLYDKIKTILAMNSDEKTHMEEKARSTIDRMNPDEIYRQLMGLYERVILERKQYLMQNSGNGK